MDDQQSRRQLLKPDQAEREAKPSTRTIPKNDTTAKNTTTVSTVNTPPAAEVMKPTDVAKTPSGFLAGLIFGLGSKVTDMDVKAPQLDQEFICGWGAAFINITSTFPINKAIFRQQLQGISGYQAMQQLSSEGLRHLYRGLLPPLLQKTTTVSIMFGSYQNFRVRIDNFFPGVPQPVNHAVAAIMAGTLEATLAPFERIQTLLQNQTYQKRFNNTWHAGKELWAFGLREYYRGLTPILMRNGPSNVVFFLGREYLSEHTPDFEKGPSRLAKDFICGACLGAVISTFFFPLNVVKTRMQSQVGGPFNSVWKSFQVVWAERDRSLKSLFRGYHLNYTRSFISWGIINASYEYLMQLFHRAKTTGLLQAPHMQEQVSVAQQELATPEHVHWKKK
ncbi:hypothetical protein BaRGS_00033849 [Batillaria attramentaria]|uniref:Mitochondrial carrier protein n=1 Tax=Batillaria attramentaria TaxID=370345 RepID=A0ABD0JIV5_9CAEN